MAEIQKKKNGRLFVFVAGIVAAAVIVVNVIQISIVSHLTESKMKNETIEEYKEFAKAYSNIVGVTLDKYFAHLDFYTNAEVVKTLDTPQIVNWLRSTASVRDQAFDYVAWVDASANFYADNGSQTSIPDRDYFQAIMKGGKDVFIDNPVKSKTTGKTIVHICKAAKVGGRTVGFFSGIVNFNRLSVLLGNVELGARGDAVLFSGTGNMIATSGDFSSMLTEFAAQGKNSNELSSKVISEVSAGRSGYMWHKDSKRNDQLVIFEPVRNTSWSMLLMLKEKVVVSTAKSVSSMMIVGGVLLAIIVLLIVIGVLYSALKPLNVIEKSINGIASGDADLTKRIDLNSNNEIGRVVGGFNLFSEKLQKIVAAIKDSKNELVHVGENFSACAEDTSAAITQILANIESMGNQINNQSSSVTETAGAVNQIASNIESLNRMIESQASAVTQASAAVEEMIENINSVNNSVTKMADEFEDLERKVVLGVKKQDDVNGRIQVIESESKSLQEANAVISNIAEQTNLLAMNAAIEAAHAGEAGKGFSVVADEIRKLSETSSSQSKTIGEQLKNITDSIEGIVSASMEAKNSFADVSVGISDTTNLVHEIKNAMMEQGEGSKQISIALNAMNDSSNEVRNASREMAEGNKQILVEIRNLQDTTSSMKTGMDEMSVGATKINETGVALTNISKTMDGAMNKIGEQVDKFKV